MIIAPKSPKDLALAPVAAAIDRNLQVLRDKPVDDIRFTLQLAFNREDVGSDPVERAESVRDYAIQFVDLYGWDAEVTEDRSGIRLSGGSVSIELSFGSAIERFIEDD